VSVEAHTRDMVARWTRDHRGEGTARVGLPDRYRLPYNRGNERGSSRRGGRSASFPCVCVSRPHPLALEVTGGLDKAERRVGRSGNELGAGSTGCDDGINERLREEEFFAILSPPIFGKTEVTRELD
jgi:hypothetical protein